MKKYSFVIGFMTSLLLVSPLSIVSAMEASERSARGSDRHVHQQTHRQVHQQTHRHVHQQTHQHTHQASSGSPAAASQTMTLALNTRVAEGLAK